MRTGFLLCALVSGTLVTWAQETATFNANQRMPLPIGNFIDVVGEPECDGSGNTYIRPASKKKSDDPEEYLLAPVRQITRDGKLGETFRLVNGSPDSDVGRGIFVDKGGDVYEALIGPGGVYVAHFAKDGSLRSKTKLETSVHLDPWHIVVFPSGRFLLSGESGKDQRSPYAALFDANGQLLKEIFEPEDDLARRRAEGGDAEFTRNSQQGNVFVSRGDVTLGSDGNAYLLHGTSPLVYVISSEGRVIRKMTIGEADSTLAFRAVKSYEGKLAIALATFGHIEVRVTDLEGKAIENYRWDSDKVDVLGLACYDVRGFTFVTVAARNSPYLINAKP
jgi:hypothetical protein